jgi:hypothetical protein
MNDAKTKPAQRVSLDFQTHLAELDAKWGPPRSSAAAGRTAP